MNEYEVILVNCDCASGTTARLSNTKAHRVRCPYCHRLLGDMQTTFVGRVKADNKWEAIRRWKALPAQEQTNRIAAGTLTIGDMRRATAAATNPRRRIIR